MKKKYFLLFFLLLIVMAGKTEAQKITPVPYYPMLNWDTSPYKSFRYTRPDAAWEWINFRMLFPNGYDSAAMDGKEYPLVIMLHGAGESGRMEWDNSSKTNTPYPSGDPRIDNNDHQLLFGAKEHLNAVNNGRFPGFVVFPQNFYGTWVNGKGSASSGLHKDLLKAMELAEYLTEVLKIDPSRIYIHGLSNGAAGTWYAAYSRPELFAAALPMSAPGDPAMAEQLAKVPLWVFQGALDTNPRPFSTKQTIEAVLNAGGEVRYTEYENAGHNTWNRAYGERDFFEWMLGQVKGTDQPNQLPVVNAGDDKTINLPANSATIAASGVDPDGAIASYLWEKLSGPEAVMAGMNTSVLELSELTEGTYRFRVTVTDNRGGSAFDEVELFVVPAENKTPVVNAGEDKEITLPENTASFTATASDPDGTIASYLWEKVSGPDATLSGINSATINLEGLTEGTYVFRVTVTDNSGAQATDGVSLVVNPSATENMVPVVNAGEDKNITLPDNSTSFTATASDPDGTIASYLWEKVSGPEAAMEGVNSPDLTLSMLTEGSYTFKVTVTDNDGATASDEVGLAVEPAGTTNEVPVASAGPDETLTLPASSIILKGMATDNDGTIASYMWEKVSGPSVTMGDNNTANLQLSDLTEGVYVFRFSATDNDGATDSDEMTLTVNPSAEPENIDPQVTAGNDKSITLPVNTSSFTAVASDEDGTIESILWDKMSGPAATMTGGNTATISLSDLTEGTYTFKVTVMDNKGAVATDEVGLVVKPEEVSTPGNQVPVAYAGSDKSITLPENSKTLYGRATDSDGRLVAYKWEKVSGPSVTMGNPNTANVNLSDLVEGEYVFRFLATDNGGATGTDEITLTVSGGDSPTANQKPTVDAGPGKSIQLPANTASFTASASDPDGTIVSYLWNKVSGPEATMTGGNSATISLSDLTQGTYTFKVTATDNEGATATDQVSLVVRAASSEPGNQVPVAYAGSDKSITLPENSKTLYGRATDSDGRLVAYKWEKVSGPSVTMGNQNTANVNLSDLVEGEYVFRFLATDNGGATGTDEMTLTVSGGDSPTANQKPTVDAGPGKSIQLPANTASFTASASDPDGTIVSYLWNKVSGPEATMTGGNSATISLSDLTQGTYTFMVTVTDNEGAVATDKVSLVVRAASSEPGNQVPVAYAGSDKSITLPENSKTLYGRASDSDGRLVAYKWEKVSGPSVTMGNPNTANVNLSDLMEGEYVFRFSATDNEGATGSDEMTLTVIAAAGTTSAMDASPVPANKVMAFPNTFDNKLSLMIESETDNEVYQVAVFDFNGRMVHKEKLRGGNKGKADFPLDLSDLNISSGTYLIQVKGEKTPFLEIIRVMKR